MSYLFLGLFLVSVVIHLYASKVSNKKLRGFSKPFIVLSLLGFYCTTADSVSLLIVIALLTSWIGDVLLIGPSVKWFTVGGIAFWISHLCYILGYSKLFEFSDVPVYAVIILSVLYLVVVTIIFSRLKQYLPNALFFPMACYLYTNGTMNMFAYFRLIANPCLPSVITAVGALLFFLSDSTLFFVRFNKNCRIKTHFLVMLTYSIGEFLIILGLLI